MKRLTKILTSALLVAAAFVAVLSSRPALAGSQTINVSSKEDLISAFANESTDDITIKLTGDVDFRGVSYYERQVRVKGNRTIDLNGYRLVTDNAVFFVFTIRGKIGKITDSSAGTTGRYVVSHPSSAYGVVDMKINAKCELVLSNFKFESDNYQDTESIVLVTEYSDRLNVTISNVAFLGSDGFTNLARFSGGISSWSVSNFSGKVHGSIFEYPDTKTVADFIAPGQEFVLDGTVIPNTTPLSTWASNTTPMNLEIRPAGGTTTHPTKPIIPAPADLTYNGSNQSPTLTGFDSNTMNISGNVQTNAGTYTASITSKTGQWADSSTDAVTVTWKILPFSIDTVNVTGFTNNLVFGGNAMPSSLTIPSNQPYILSGLDSKWQKYNEATTSWEYIENTATVVAGKYRHAFFLQSKDPANMKFRETGLSVTVDGATWTEPADVLNASGISRAIIFSPVFIINDPVVNVPKPTFPAPADLTYNGANQSPTLVGFDPATMNISGNTAVNAGTYTALVTPKTGQWADSSTDAVNVTWKINKANPTVATPVGLEGEVGETLATVALPAGFSWDLPTQVIAAGANTYIASFTPTDTANYNSVLGIAISVNGVLSDYAFLNGANQIYNADVDTEVVFRIDADFSLFTKVFINDVELDPTNYTAVNGSVKISLNQAYLNTLVAGVYNLRAEFSNGRVARTQFTVRRGLPAQPGTSGNAAAPATGSYGNNLVLLVSATSLILLGWLGLLTHRRSVKQAN